MFIWLWDVNADIFYDFKVAPTIKKNKKVKSHPNLTFFLYMQSSCFTEHVYYTCVTYIEKAQDKG